MKYTSVTIPKFPSNTGVTEIALAIDTSGSTYNILEPLIRTTVKDLVTSLAESGRFKVTLWAFDNYVHHQSIQTITEQDVDKVDDILDVTLSYGGGGSSYIESFYLVKSIYFHAQLPTAIVFITDGYFGSYEVPPDMAMEKHVVLLNDSQHPCNFEVFPFEHSVHTLTYTK